MKLCLDFDGVLHDPKTRLQGRRLGQPLKGAHEACWALVRAGHELYVHSARMQNADVEWVHQWLRYFDFPSMHVWAFKPPCDLYVDDKAHRFQSWDTVQDIVLYDYSPFTSEH